MSLIILRTVALLVVAYVLGCLLWVSIPYLYALRMAIEMTGK